MSSANAGWPIVSLSEVTERIMVGIASAATHAYRPSGVPLIRNQNIKPGALDDRDLLYVDPGYERAFKNKRLREGDLLTVRTGYPGTTCVVPAAFEGAQSFTTLISRPQRAKVDSRFLSHYINSELGQSFFTQSQIGGAQKNVNAGVLRGMPLPLPPTEEQRAVGAVLDSADSLIGTLERMVAKKHDIKQGLMQELLTGRTRLAGFDGEWSTVTVGQLGSFLKGRGIKRDDVRPSGIPCVRYGELYTTYVDYTASTVSFVRPAVAATALPIRMGDILFAGSGETKEEIGMSVAYTGEKPAVAGGDIIVLRGTGYNPVFLASLLNSPEVAAQKARGGQGDAVVHINWRFLADIKVTVPQLPEQRAIAEIFQDADAEIAIFERQLKSARSIKTGMTQELLTGRTRLHVEGGS
ncbi:restriction endonuclease subunit S [Streptomyces atroolivaceus]|uniref:restriction endonuclease subunit S n=1 Tax=Streptomyces atroolivaceus TaxID=66869 RepID=UPI003411B516